MLQSAGHFAGVASAATVFAPNVLAPATIRALWDADVGRVGADSGPRLISKHLQLLRWRASWNKASNMHVIEIAT